MDEKKSLKLLKQLHDEINKTQAVDDKGRKILRDLELDLQALLERSKKAPRQVHPSFVGTLQEALDHFEVTHPDLTMLISKFLDSLSTAGI